MTGRDSVESSFEELYQQAPAGYLSTTPEGVIVQVNDTLLAWTGHSRQQLLGTAFRDLLTAGSRLFLETRYLPVLRLEGEVREVALTMLRADGSQLSVLVNSVFVRDQAGEPRLVRTAVFDSTARQDYERELLDARREAEASEARVRVLQHASSAFGSSTSEEALAGALAESARTAFSAVSAAVFLRRGSNELRLMGGSYPLDGLQPHLRPEHTALSSAEVLTVADLSAAGPELAAALRSARLEALSATPLVEGGETLGSVVCFFGRGRPFDAQDLELHRALARQAAEVIRRLRLQAELRALALHDQLTGLANRKLLEERMTAALAATARKNRPMTLIFLDLDGFKPVNDMLGHVIGDTVLRGVADRVRAAVRIDDVVGRFGGDEFVVICEDADAQAALLVAERIRAAVRAGFDGVPPELPISASVGIAVYVPGEGRVPNADEMFSAADTAMYESKDAGKDRVTLVRL